MTSPFEPVAKGALRVQKRGDLLINFRNRDPDQPDDPEAFLDYPVGVTGVLTIETSPDPIEIPATPSGHDCVIRLPASQADVLKTQLWSFKLRYPDVAFVDGYFDKVVVNGKIARDDS